MQRAVAADPPAVTCQSVNPADSCTLQHTGSNYTLTAHLTRTNRVCADDGDMDCLLTYDVLSRKLASKDAIRASRDTLRRQLVTAQAGAHPITLETPQR